MTEQKSSQVDTASSKDDENKPSGLAMMMAATGVVFGDIGTSPLYSLKEIFSADYGVGMDRSSILGILSLVFWTLTVVVTIKYVAVILNANNQGEGGIMALTALARRSVHNNRWLTAIVIILGLLGTGLFYGDSLITPAVSVLSAVEGIELKFPNIAHWTVPMSVVLLFGLFSLQRHGTAKIGRLFGPVMVFWFLSLAALGINGIIQTPTVLNALNPYWIVLFFYQHPLLALGVMGAVVLTVTGTEALYADLGHFGRAPIVRSWLYLIFPCLVLNYFGQGALLMHDAKAVRMPFFLLAPSWALLPLIIVSTLATIIASQSVISGTFSITQQAIQLGYLPRMQINHTSEADRGQIYVPFVNTLLTVGVLLLVIAFKSSSNLAVAYGLAVTGTMVITTLLVSAVVLARWRRALGWRWYLMLPLLALFLVIDLIFFSSNLPKILTGGALPAIVAVIMFIIMTTWKRGRRLLLENQDGHSLPIDQFIDSIGRRPPLRVPGTAVFLTSRPDVVPHALLHNLLHNHVLHEKVVLVNVRYSDLPRIPVARRAELKSFDQGFHQVILHFGFTEEPDIPKALLRLETRGLNFDPMTTTYFVSRETVIPSKHIGMAHWREKLFATMTKNAANSLSFFNLPVNRVIELGTQVEI